MSRVLVTGALGLVGSAVVERLAADGVSVVAADIPTSQNRARARDRHREGIDVRWADLTEPAQADELLARTLPEAVIHLAAVIPPMCYAKRSLARGVNVDATGNIVSAAERLELPPRFVQASSIAVYGSRNPHRTTDLLTADTPLDPSDNYGAHKQQAERIVRESRLDWVVLRLGGVLTVEHTSGMNLDNVYFESLLPGDGRIQTVDVRDVATAFAAAVDAPVRGETLLIGGDRTHRTRQGEIAPEFTAALGLDGAVPAGRPGDPADDRAWFTTDWMDTARAQQALNFQHHSWPEMLREIRTTTGRRRHLLRPLAPLLRMFLSRRAAYRDHPGRFADPWQAITAKWGPPGPDDP